MPISVKLYLHNRLGLYMRPFRPHFLSLKCKTRAITNFNHMHALTVQYYEVVQLYRTTVELARIKVQREIQLSAEATDSGDFNTEVKAEIEDKGSAGVAEVQKSWQGFVYGFFIDLI